MHLLLLEDDAELGEAIKHALEQQSYAVTWLTDGRHGAAALADGSVDLVLLDLGLPGKDGLEVLLEARRAGVKTPILVMTARDAPEARIKGLDLGADDYRIDLPGGGSDRHDDGMAAVQFKSNYHHRIATAHSV
jgi:two-component system response regulator QseB